MNETPQPPPPAATPPPPAADPATVAYPVQATIDRQDEYSRFLPLIKWLLLIPHYVALFVLGLAALVVMIIAFFAVLFTRHYPRGLFNFVVGVHRWSWRVGAYLFLMTDRYPPFSLQDDPDYPARYDIAYPEEGVGRWRPFFAWIAVYPYLLVLAALMYAVLTIVFFAFFTILFAKRFPAGFFQLALIALRWQARGNAYAYWLITKYPTRALD